MKTIYLAGGCFWGIQRFIDSAPGIVETVVGYANGNTPDPTYDEVKTQRTGHAETCFVRYDEQTLLLSDLLNRFLSVIDPLAVNRQGEDEGSQYRTGIYYTDSADLTVIQKAIASLEEKLGQKCAVEVCPLICFYPAEDYHQKYLEKNPHGYCHIHCVF